MIIFFVILIKMSDTEFEEIVDEAIEEMLQQDEWNRINKQQEKDFPNLPITLSLPYDTLEEYIEDMDRPFTDQKTIIVKDDRAVLRMFEWELIPENEIQQYVNYTVINKIEDRPITLRQIFTEMSRDPHYHRARVISQNHRFLEDIYWSTDIEITFGYGS
jgi:hypothetical protein